jgi:hypothetical protein
VPWELAVLVETSVKPSISLAMRRQLAKMTWLHSKVCQRWARRRSEWSRRPPSRLIDDAIFFYTDAFPTSGVRIITANKWSLERDTGALRVHLPDPGDTWKLKPVKKGLRRSRGRSARKKKT